MAYQHHQMRLAEAELTAQLERELKEAGLIPLPDDSDIDSDTSDEEFRYKRKKSEEEEEEDHSYKTRWVGNNNF